MIKFLVKKLVPNYQDTKNQKVRESYCVLGGGLGICCNIFLFIIKLIIGIIVKASAITSDAFNNLTDSFSSIVSIISAKLSNKKPDKDHPFGHGRIEYLATLIVAAIILVVGATLGINAVKGFISGIKDGGEALEMNTTTIISMVILGVSLLVKLWMYSYNKYLGKKIDSSVLLAASTDSISDVLTSTSIIVVTILGALFLGNYFYILDNGMSLIVAVIICINGLKIISETIGDLLGRPASKETIDELEAIILSKKQILGTHDLMVHDYGPGRKFASVHAEVNAKSNIVEAHEIIDEIEQICYAKTGIELTIHMDPIDFDSKEVKDAMEVLNNVVNQYEGLSFHDLRITDGKNNINVIFDLVIPHHYTNEEVKNITDNIKKNVKALNSLYTLVIKIDRPFVE